MKNRDKLRALVLDAMLLTEREFSFELKRADVRTWDSLGIVTLGIGVEETFAIHLTPDELTAVTSIPELMRVLAAKGLSFDE